MRYNTAYTVHAPHQASSRSERNRRALPGPNSRPRHHSSLPDSAHLLGTANAAPRLSRPPAHPFLAIVLALVPPLQAPKCITMTAKCLPSVQSRTNLFPYRYPPATQIGRLFHLSSFGTPELLVRDVRGEYRGIRTAGRFLPASGAHRARMTSTPTASETSTHFLSTVMTGTASARPRTRHTRSPSDRPLDRVTSRKAPAM